MNSEFKKGDIVVYKGDIDEIVFVGEHKGAYKIMTSKLMKTYPNMEGWTYETKLRHATSQEKEEYLSKKPLPVKWFVRFSDYRDIEDYLISKYGEVASYIANGSDEKILLSEDDRDFVSPKYATHISLLEHVIPNYQEIIMEQFKKHFTQIKKSNTMSRFPFKLTQENAKRIIAIACSAWKDKLSEIWGKELLLTGYVSISEEFYREMRGACTRPQHGLFDQIFGKDNTLKRGDIVVVMEEYNGNAAKSGQVVKILEVDDTSIPYRVQDYLKKYDWSVSHDNGTWCRNVRLATEEEIAEASSPYKDGELAFVKRSASDMWIVRYTTGKLKSNGLECYNDQKKSGQTTSWRYHAPIGETLPEQQKTNF